MSYVIELQKMADRFLFMFNLYNYIYSIYIYNNYIYLELQLGYIFLILKIYARFPK